MSKINLDSTFKNFLTNPGFQYEHPETGALSLEDIFVFPELKIGSLEVSSNELLKINTSENKILILGPEDAGKTALLKVLFRHCYLSNHYPVHLDFNDFILTAPEEILEIIEKRYCYIYTQNPQQLIQNSKMRKIIFIDNFGEGVEDVSLLTRVLKILYDNFEDVILTATTPQRESKDILSLSSFLEQETTIDKYEIMELNNELCSELIWNWYKKVNPDKTNNYEASTILQNQKKLIESLISNKLVPSYAIYILNILQINSDDYSSELKTSSYVSHYEELIKKSLSSAVADRNIDLYLDFLSETAYFLFINKKTEVDSENLSAILNKHFELEKPESVVNTLTTSNIFSAAGENYRFSDNYFYPYFTARFISAHLDSKISEIRDICQELDDDDNANIILFLTHLSDEPAIIDELLLKAESVYSDDKLMSDEDSVELKELVKELSDYRAKDRKLREDAARYYISTTELRKEHMIINKIYGKNIGELSLEENKKRFKAAKNLLKIILDLLHSRSG